MKEAGVTVETAAKILKLLGDKTRLTMIALVLEDECCVCEFVELFQMSQPAVSQHLRKLRDVGLVNEERRGQWIFYKANKDHEAYPMVEQLINHLPDQKQKLEALAEQGLRVNCCD
ncbi:ArsR/SmtB family transcription factor [Desertibacillus haloalkaliphilus]|uniref:ArsR/SmtB family transcription factor n=1 Tax=Desertibacillus haloalkaliphilus TaxID=1328930 RepID=UPI001C273D07|nr:metalloregulator ArsR/SmtB family transcription factor [Desertibacillus haloalkaliphilus]MBU8906664.1 metalloregulator ArsR/SmtB family transcription factor [Desertibacillus haloalkaliphilus]